MSRFCDFIHQLKRGIRRICFVDRWLLFIFAVLLLESGHNLLFPMEISGELKQIDVIFRTSLASIFGYLISKNFNHCHRRTDVGEGCKVSESREQRGGKYNGLQIVTISVICLYCIAVLILLRNRGIVISTNHAGVIVQFRDFISAGIGYLIGYPTPSPRQ